MAKRLTDAQILRQIPAARLRGRLREAEPWWPKRVAFDLDRDSLRLTLRNGVEWLVPRKRIPELRRATDDDLIQVVLSGEAIRWDTLDVDLSIPGLAADVFGESFFAKVSGRIRGRIRTKAKSTAARANGLKGGRPRKNMAASRSKLTKV